MFPCGDFLSHVVHEIVYQSALISRKLLCPKKIPGYAPVPKTAKITIF